MTLTTRDLQVAVDHHRQVQLLAEAARGALDVHQYNVRFLAGDNTGS